MSKNPAPVPPPASKQRMSVKMQEGEEDHEEDEDKSPHTDPVSHTPGESGGKVEGVSAAAGDETADDEDDMEQDELTKKMLEEQEERENEIMNQGTGMVDDEENMKESPDNVQTLVKTDSKGNVVVFTTTAATPQRTALKACAEYFVISLKACFKNQKFTAIYPIGLFLALIMFVVLLTRAVKWGTPVTDNSEDAHTRIFISVIMCCVISIAAFFILNLSITNLSLGLLWMYLIVSLLYFVLTCLSKAAYGIQSIQGSKSIGSRFQVVFSYTSRYINRTNPPRLPKYFKEFAKKHGCCDFECKPKCVLSTMNKTETTYNTSLWDALLNYGNVAGLQGRGNVPGFCCDSKATLSSFCNIKDADANDSSYFCKREELFDEVRIDMILSVSFSCILLILCIVMALVFWYYYSNLKSVELEETQIPGDYALLYSRLHRPRLADGKTDKNTRKEMKKLKERHRKQQIEQKFGLVEGEATGDGPRSSKEVTASEAAINGADGNQQVPKGRGKGKHGKKIKKPKDKKFPNVISKVDTGLKSPSRTRIKSRKTKVAPDDTTTLKGRRPSVQLSKASSKKIRKK